MSTSTIVTPPKPGTRQAAFLEQLRGGGASMPDLMLATGWQWHTVRAAMTGLRKRGFLVERVPTADDADDIYRVKEAASRARRRK